MSEAALASFRLDGRVALITGGAGGIGLAVARRFAAAGASVALADMNSGALDREVGRFTAEGTQAFGVQVNVGVAEEITAMVDAVVSHYGRIDILVNNAGVMGRAAPIWELTDEDWYYVIDTDLTSVFRVTRAVAARMRKRSAGSIISIASIAGKEGTANLAPYSVAKAGIIAFTKAVGKELIAYGIRVNCVAPGVVSTPLLEQLPPQATQLMLSKAPMGRFGTPDEVAAVVHFLASDAASFITSQCFDASGGRATY